METWWCHVSPGCVSYVPTPCGLVARGERSNGVCTEPAASHREPPVAAAGAERGGTIRGDPVCSPPSADRPRTYPIVPSLTVLGLVAGLLTSLAFLPQVIRTWRTRSAEDLSAVTFTMFCLGVLLWLVYGVLLQDLPIILANGATLVMAGAILAMKLAFARRSPAPTEPPVDARP